MQFGGEDGGRGHRGVSQVIAVVLLVAIVVLLVGVVGVYVTGFGGEVRSPAPTFASTTTFDPTWDANGQYLNITHKSGQSLDTDRLHLDVNDAERVVPSSGSRASAELVNADIVATQVGPEFTATETIVVDRRLFRDGAGALSGSKQVDLSDATVRIIYTPEGEERSETIYECRPAVPDCEEAPT